MAIIFVVIAMLVIGSAVYMYSQNNSESVLSTGPSQTLETTISPSSAVEPVVPVQSTSSKINSNVEPTQTYTNTKFGFKFTYPASWKMIGEIGERNARYRPPYLFDEILTTENHPINRAGHVSVLSLSFDEFMKEVQNSNVAQVKGLVDLKTESLTGKKFKFVYKQSEGSITQQIDYVYALSLGDNVLFISFTSMNTSEKEISKELELRIDRLINTISTI